MFPIDTHVAHMNLSAYWLVLNFAANMAIVWLTVRKGTTRQLLAMVFVQPLLAVSGSTPIIMTCKGAIDAIRDYEGVISLEQYTPTQLSQIVMLEPSAWFGIALGAGFALLCIVLSIMFAAFLLLANKKQ